MTDQSPLFPWTLNEDSVTWHHRKVNLRPAEYAIFAHLNAGHSASIEDLCEAFDKSYTQVYSAFKSMRRRFEECFDVDIFCGGAHSRDKISLDTEIFMPLNTIPNLYPDRPYLTFNAEAESLVFPWTREGSTVSWKKKSISLSETETAVFAYLEEGAALDSATAKEKGLLPSALTVLRHKARNAFNVDLVEGYIGIIGKPARFRLDLAKRVPR